MGLTGGAETGGGGEVSSLAPLAVEVAEVLAALGGAAHRDLVLAHLAKRRGLLQAPTALGQALDETFAAHGRQANDPLAPALLHLPHGPGSQRWALTDWAQALVRAAAESR
jgi:hypothetical protein